MADTAGPSSRLDHTPQPGDGAYLANNRYASGSHIQQPPFGYPRGGPRGRGRGEARGGFMRGNGRGRGGRIDGPRSDGISHMNGGEPHHMLNQPHPFDSFSTQHQQQAQAPGHGPSANGMARGNGHHAHDEPRRPRRPRSFAPLIPSSSGPSTSNSGRNDNSDGTPVNGTATAPADPSANKEDIEGPSGKGRGRKRSAKSKDANGGGGNGGDQAVDGVVSGLASLTMTQTKNSPDGHLDPSASSFVPSANTSGPVSRASSRHSTRPSSPTADGKPAKTKKRKPKAKKPPVGGVDSTEASASAAAGARSSRRAAFEQQTKLTTTHNDDGEVSGQGRVLTEKGKELMKADGQQKGTSGKGGKTMKEDKDDLVSRLTRGLKSRPYLECPICFNSITPHQQIWSCLPPSNPPIPPKNPLPDEPPPDLVKHYSACYTPFHLTCIRDWANRSLVEERERARGYGKDEDDVSWRCPGCQKRRAEMVGGYKCFCGRVTSPGVGHGCGEGCGRKRSGCEHACPLTCHPGPCPPCQVALVVPCPSHHTGLTVKCAVASSNNAALTPVCDEVCARDRNCGNPDHVCQELCHFGPCSKCTALEIVRCYCGAETKEAECGWNRKEEKRCSALNDDGSEKSWVGRYCCGRSCVGVYACGVHPCEQTCHPHPIKPLTCPLDPSVVTHCACGQTPLQLLPVPERTKCLDPIPTCNSRCPKSRPCGHQCTRNCHLGECPPCHEEVVKHCRCGESMLVVPCDEMRAKKETGEDVTCERVCKALRNCGRHECGRICCPLSYKAKSRKARKTDEEARLEGADDLHECHLTCGRMLSCGLHTCTRGDHKGACGRCLQASYDELICHCGNTVVYPPVPCGATISCLYPCARPPPPCGHPRTPHTCHENDQCPPCPFLATKPCLCGKDPAVKNVRCSQEKISCGQTCGKLLGCGYHRCQKLCHSPATQSATSDGTTEGGCEECKQTCGKPKRVCGHACTASCHAPAKCPENEPCQAIVTISCPCGHLQQRSNCGASANVTASEGTEVKQGREKVGLKCNSECAVRARNARLADALGIGAGGTGRTGNEVEWPEELLTFARANVGFVKVVEGTFEGFLKGTRSSQILPYMPIAKRTFVMSLADIYRLGKELVDQEPNRSVLIRRKTESRLPTPLLSSLVAPASSGNKLGGLANLRSTGGSSSGTTTPNGSAGTRSWGTPAPISTQPTRGWGGGAGGGGGSMAGVLSASAGSAGTSRTATPTNGSKGSSNTAPTPVAPMASVNGAIGASSTLTAGAGASTASAAGQAGQAALRRHAEGLVGKVGEVDEGDWDLSDSEDAK